MKSHGIFLKILRLGILKKFRRNIPIEEKNPRKAMTR